MRDKDIRITVVFVLSVSLMTTMLTAVCLSGIYRNRQFWLLDNFCQLLIEEHVADADRMMAVLKENQNRLRVPAGRGRYGDGILQEAEEGGYQNGFLTQYGYSDQDFIEGGWGYGYFSAVACFAAGVLAFLSAFYFWHKKECRQMEQLAEYLEQARAGKANVLAAVREGEYSRLQDEILKTVTELYQMRDAAVAAKHNYADHLYNIAHQLKTPITAVSLSAQMIKEAADIAAYAEKIQKQAERLAYLEEALLLLSRVDAGTLTLKKKKTDVYTLLNLAADSLQELFSEAEVAADIPEMGEAEIFVDMEWTMEAVINLLKNCMEHSPAGAAVHCAYWQNPLYVQIRIWDEGEGFAKEDMPHLFERFYRGRRAGKEGVGIGLALAKEILTMQNGMVGAGNLPAREGGAYFEIRMYCR